MKKWKALMGVALSIAMLAGGINPQTNTFVSKVQAATSHELALNVTVQDLDVTVIRKDTDGNPIFADIVKEDLPKNAKIRLNLEEGNGTAGYEISYVKLGDRTATLAELGEGQTWDVDAVNNTLEVVYAPTMNPNDSFDVTFYDYDYSSAEGNGINNEGNYPQEASPEQRIGIGISGDDYHVNGVVTHPDWGINTPYGSDLGGYNYGLMVNVTNPKTNVTQTINANQNNGVNGGIEGTNWPLAVELIKNLDEAGNPVWGTNANGDQIYDPGLFTDESKIGKTIYTKDTAELNSNSKLNFNREGYHYVLTGATVGDTTTAAGLNNPRFYPLDNVSSSAGQKFVDPWVSGAANEDTDPHNWYFGIRHEFDFTLGEYVGELNYKFEGDDDVWVFLDGELVLDLGGVHCVYPSEYNNAQDKIDRGENAWNNEVDLWDFIKDAQGNYEKDAPHHVTILYMERGGYDSNCYMEFTIPVNPPADFDATIDIPLTVKWQGLDEAEEHGNNPTTQDPVIYLLDGSQENAATVDAVKTKLENKEIPDSSEYVYTQTMEDGILKDEAGKTVVFEKASLDEGVTEYTALATQYDDFDAVITGNMSDGFTVTYVYNPQKTSVSIRKNWNPQGSAQASATVRLLANGSQYGEPIELSDQNQWTATVSDLLVRRNGRTVDYSFEEVDTPDGFTASLSGSAANGFVITNNKNYSANYEFKKADDSMPNLPGSVLELLPVDQNKYKNGDAVRALLPQQTTVEMAGGTWTFTGYEEDGLTVAEDDVTFVGVWSYTARPEYDIAYEFVSGTEGRELPAEIVALTPPGKTVYEGTTVSPLMPTETSFDDGAGVWTFQSYDKGEVTVTTDVTYLGTWTYEAKPTFTVSHTYVSQTPQYDLPEEIAAMAPAAYDAIQGTTVNPTFPAQTVVDDPQDPDYYWTLVGYDKQNVVVEDDVVFVGGWERIRKPTVDVTYVFQSDDGTELPAEVMALKPVDTVVTWNPETTFYAENIAQTSVEAADKSGIWTFVSWDEESHTADENMTFTGTWHFEPYPEFNVAHTFVSGTPGMELPAEVKALEPADFNIKKTHTAYAEYPSTTRVETADGVWTFENYDKLKVENVDADVEFVGTWTYMAKPSYPVTHSFVSGTEGKELPEEVKALRPADITVTEGSNANAVNPSQTVVEMEDGVWKFVSYDKESASDIHEAVEFIGTWTWTEYTFYPVTYEFVSATAGKELPAEVVALTPASTTVKGGDNVDATAPSQTSVVTDEGTWVFESYDKDQVTNVDEEVKFTGTWKFTAKPVYPVNHIFVSGTEGMELPEEIVSMTPGNFTVMQGQSASATAPATTTVETEDGSWIFMGYDKDQETDVNDDVTFTGTWTYEAKPIYDVTYEFVSGTEGRELPAEVSALTPAATTAKEGETVDAQAPAQISVEVEDGTWVFVSYDKDQETDIKGDVKFTGTWTFTDKPVYSAKHVFVSGTEGRKLPGQITALTPADFAVMQGKTATATAPEVIKVETEDGTWIFTGYDMDRVMGVNDDVTFTGTWTFTEKAAYVVTHIFVSGTEGKELPQEIISLLPSTNDKYENGQQVTPEELSKIVVETTDGVWRFKNWDKAGAVIDNKDVEFDGVWVFTAKANTSNNNSGNNNTSASQPAPAATASVPAISPKTGEDYMKEWGILAALATTALALTVSRRKKEHEA